MVAGTLPSSNAPTRMVESEGILRMLLLVLALAMPLGTLAYLKIQSTRLSYAMGELKPAGVTVTRSGPGRSSSAYRTCRHTPSRRRTGSAAPTRCASSWASTVT